MGYGNGNVMSCRVIDLLIAGTQFPFTPGRDDGQIRIQRFYGQFKTYLIVALAGSAVSHRIGAFLVGNVHQVLSDQRTGKGRPQQIFLFIYGAGLYAGPYIIGDEVFFQIQNVAFAGAGFDSLVMHRSQFVALTQVSADRNDLAVVIILL